MWSKLPNTFCPNPWTQICATPQSALAVCGEARATDARTPLTEFFPSERLNELRRALASGERPAHCQTCWNQEAEGRYSTRQQTLDLYAHTRGKEFSLNLLNESAKNNFVVPYPQKVDIKLGSHCNLACRMCSPDNSIKLWKEYNDNKKEFEDFEPLYEVARDLYENPRKPDSVEEWISVSPQISRINISGGEPTMLKGVQEYLTAFHEKGFSKNVTLTFNTNGTRANRELYKTIKFYKKVELYISIDGTDSVYEYIRYPSKWTDTQKSVLSIKEFFSDSPNVHIYVTPTYQVLNILNLSDIYRWCDSVGLDWVSDSFVTDPTFHNASILPAAIRFLAADRLEKYFSQKTDPTFRQSYAIPKVLKHWRSDIEPNPNELRNFDNHTRIMDKVRQQQFSESCPELYQLLRENLRNSDLSFSSPQL